MDKEALHNEGFIAASGYGVYLPITATSDELVMMLTGVVDKLAIRINELEETVNYMRNRG